MGTRLTKDFERALKRVLDDFDLNPGGEGSDGADLTAVGVRLDDCRIFLALMLEDEPRPVSDEFLSMLVQWSIATGVWIERARWSVKDT